MKKGKCINKDFLTVEIPEGMEELSNLRLPDPQLVEYYERLKERKIYLNGLINDDFVDYYHNIIKWNKEDESSNIPIEDRIPIKIYINSDGGSLEAVMAICDIIKISKTPVYTIGLSKCNSSGCLLLLAGQKRYLLKDCTVLIHDGYTSAGGTTGKMIDTAEFLKITEIHVKEYILSNSTITEKEYDANYRKDWWMFADEAVSYHIADLVVTDIAEIL